MKAKPCFECINFYPRYDKICDEGHKPRHYMPRNGNPYDPLAGYKRKCAEFKQK
jgi:hypothetical protein